MSSKWGCVVRVFMWDFRYLSPRCRSSWQLIWLLFLFVLMEWPVTHHSHANAVSVTSSFGCTTWSNDSYRLMTIESVETSDEDTAFFQRLNHDAVITRWRRVIFDITMKSWIELDAPFRVLLSEWVMKIDRCELSEAIEDHTSDQLNSYPYGSWLHDSRDMCFIIISLRRMIWSWFNNLQASSSQMAIISLLKKQYVRDNM